MKTEEWRNLPHILAFIFQPNKSRKYIKDHVDFDFDPEKAELTIRPNEAFHYPNAEEAENARQLVESRCIKIVNIYRHDPVKTTLIRPDSAES